MLSIKKYLISLRLDFQYLSILRGRLIKDIASNKCDRGYLHASTRGYLILFTINSCKLYEILKNKNISRLIIDNQYLKSDVKDYKQLVEQKIKSLRNHYIVHPYQDSNNNLLPSDELQQRVDKLLGAEDNGHVSDLDFLVLLTKDIQKYESDGLYLTQEFINILKNIQESSNTTAKQIQ